MSKSVRSIFSHSATTLIGTGVGALMSIAYVSIGARLLGPADYGKVGGTLSIANLFFLALNPLEAGITLGVARLAGAGRLSEVRAFLARTLRGLTVLGAALFAVGGLLVSAFRESLQVASTDAALWLGVFCCAAFVCCGPRAGLRGREMFGALAMNVVLESIVRGVVGLSLLSVFGGPGSMLAGYAVGMAVAVLHAERQTRAGLPLPSAGPAPRTRLVEDVRLPLRTLSAPLLGLNLYSVVAANVDVLMAARSLAAHEAGLYAGAASLSRLVQMAASPVLLVLFSRLAAQDAAGEDTGGTFRLSGLWIAGALAASLLVPAFAGRLALTLLLGAPFADAHAVLLVQWATTCVLIGQVFFAEALLATSRARAGWVFVLPAASLVGSLLTWHADALEIALTNLIASAVAGTLTCAALWYGRRRD